MLIANAGVLGAITPVSHMKPNVFSELISTNVTANYRLIRSLDPLLRQSSAGRAIFLTASSAHAAKPFWGGYAASKAALEALVRTYAAETMQSPLRVNLLDPGPVRTALRARAIPGENPDTLPRPDSLAGPVMDLADPSLTQSGQLFTVLDGKAVAQQR